VVQDGDAFEVVIEDDGAGFDFGEAANPAASGRGLGILGLHERMELIGGEAKVTSTPGRGTRVALRVPLTAWGEAIATAMMDA
jgi:signal transduction histidine kinase